MGLGFRVWGQGLAKQWRVALSGDTLHDCYTHCHFAVP